MSEEKQVKEYDRLRAGLQGVALFSKPTTIKKVESVTGRSSTFIVETALHDELGYFVFVELADEDGLTRMMLPPKVGNAIVAHRDSLSKRRRRATGKRLAAERKAKGILPGFLKKKRGQ